MRMNYYAHCSSSASWNERMTPVTLFIRSFGEFQELKQPKIKKIYLRVHVHFSIYLRGLKWDHSVAQIELNMSLTLHLHEHATNADCFTASFHTLYTRTRTVVHSSILFGNCGCGSEVVIALVRSTHFCMCSNMLMLLLFAFELNGKFSLTCGFFCKALRINNSC